jgi:hypothetical protein
MKDWFSEEVTSLLSGLLHNNVIRLFFVISAFGTIGKKWFA